MKEALAAGCAEHLAVAKVSIAADGVEQLVTHLVTALAELHGYYGHCYVVNSVEATTLLTRNQLTQLEDPDQSPSPQSFRSRLFESDGNATVERKLKEAFPLCGRFQNKAKALAISSCWRKTDCTFKCFIFLSSLPLFSFVMTE